MSIEALPLDLLERHGLHVEVRIEHRIDPLASTPQGLVLARRP